MKKHFLINYLLLLFPGMITFNVLARDPKTIVTIGGDSFYINNEISLKGKWLDTIHGRITLTGLKD